MFKYLKLFIIALAGIIAAFFITVIFSNSNNNTTVLSLDKDLYTKLTQEKFSISIPDEKTTQSIITVKYRPLVWGIVEADFNDFKTKVKENLNDTRGWKRAGLQFIEVENGADVDIILSDPASLGATPGCSSELSCTTWSNQVIINDLRWREGTEASRSANMSTRDYQHMVINHEMGHWLGHHQHETSCPNGGPAPIMLQQSTGMRGCDSFNAWPLDWELWTNKK